MAVQEISPNYLQQKLTESAEHYFLLDVREPFEYDIAKLQASRLIPMNQIPARLSEIDSDKKVVVICHHGMRSAQVAYFLDQQGIACFNLTGGIDAWARCCDESMALY
jgi:rhodanese-related sulfurtransferase